MKLHRPRYLLAAPLFGMSAISLASDATVPILHANQLGFGSGDTKLVILATDQPGPARWRLADAAGGAVMAGDARPFGADAASGDRVQQIDLSGLRRAGRYSLSVPGAEPVAITIAAGTLTPLKYAALNYFYQTRAGIPIEARYAGGTAWARPAGHPHEVASCFSGTDAEGNRWPGCDYTLDVTGGWYDAGDHGKYVVNGGIALWTLQDLYEQQALTGDDAFADGKVAIPESGNRINDLLDEARWEMRFMLAMQIPDGKHAMVPVGHQPRRAALKLTDIDASGMAHHKVADRVWTPLPTAPADDPQPRLLYPPSTAATLNLAATAAQCARIWRTIDPAFSRRCLTAAERAFAAALRNPAIYAPSTFVSGGYGDEDVSDEFYWAAAELYVTTGRPIFADALRRMQAFRAPLTEANWANVAALGTISLATLPNGLPATERAGLRARIVTTADGFLAEETRSGYHIPFASTAFTWGSNAVLLNRAILLGLAERITGERKYRDGAHDVVDYLLGRNPLDQSFISGFGTHPLMNPHHRFWAHALDPRYPPPPPGVLSGGPNSIAMADDVARKMKGHCVGMRCWRDANFAYSMNEVAINWNAPLVWVMAYLDSAPGKRRQR
ncbi:MAG TPA: glycoside hydrolase family 9 protein [Sphingomonas sp.]